MKNKRAYTEEELQAMWDALPGLTEEDIQRQKAEAKQKQQAQLSKEITEAFRQLRIDPFHFDLIRYKQTKSNEDFEKIWPELYGLTNRFTQKYVIEKLPIKAKYFYLSDGYQNYDAELMEVLLKTINKWEPNRDGGTLNFRSFYERAVKNYVGNVINRMKTDVYKETTIISLDTKGAERVLQECLINNIEFDQENKIVANLHLQIFIKELLKVDKSFVTIMVMLQTGKYTHAEMAKWLDCSTKTIQRKIEYIRKAWVNYNERDENSGT